MPFNIKINKGMIYSSGVIRFYFIGMFIFTLVFSFKIIINSYFPCCLYGSFMTVHIFRVFSSEHI